MSTFVRTLPISKRTGTHGDLEEVKTQGFFLSGFLVWDTAGDNLNGSKRPSPLQSCLKLARRDQTVCPLSNRGGTKEQKISLPHPNQQLLEQTLEAIKSPTDSKSNYQYSQQKNPSRITQSKYVSQGVFSL